LFLLTAVLLTTLFSAQTAKKPSPVEIPDTVRPVATRRNAAGLPLFSPIVLVRETLYTLAAPLKAGNYRNFGVTTSPDSGEL
jgi:hypothetical protein